MKLHLKLTSALLLLTMLISTIGMAVNIHECFMSGEKTIGSAVEDACCDTEKAKKTVGDDLKKADCCSVSSTHLHLDSETGSTSFLPLSLSNALFVIYQFQYPETTQISTDKFTYLSTTPHLPDRYGRSLLTLIQKFLI